MQVFKYLNIEFANWLLHITCNVKSRDAIESKKSNSWLDQISGSWFCVPCLQQPCPPSARVAEHPHRRLPAPAQPRQGVTSGLLTSSTGPGVILQAGDGAGQAQGQLPGVPTSDRV